MKPSLLQMPKNNGITVAAMNIDSDRKMETDESDPLRSVRLADDDDMDDFDAQSSERMRDSDLSPLDRVNA